MLPIHWRPYYTVHIILTALSCYAVCINQRYTHVACLKHVKMLTFKSKILVHLSLLATVNEPTALEPLTPNHLLTLKSNVVLPPPSEFQRVDVYFQKRWRRVQYLANEYWNLWRGEFVDSSGKTEMDSQTS